MVRTPRTAVIIPTLALLLWGVAGCGGARPSKYYTLQLPAVSAPPANTYAVDLLVGRITAPHLYRDDRIVYRTGSAQLGTYEYHRWAEPPTEMLEAMLVRLLRSSGKYRSVQHLRSNARGNFILRGRLHNFEEVVDGALAGRLLMEIDLFNQETGTTVWSHFYSHDEPVNGDDVGAVVEALSRNVQRALERVAAGLDDYFAKHPQK
jgi:ABC-type uncharacterized transport system auxiliary subunit